MLLQCVSICLKGRRKKSTIDAQRQRERDHSNKKELDAQKTKGNKDKVIVAQKQTMET
jgi:hypothetical protein